MPTQREAAGAGESRPVALGADPEAGGVLAIANGDSVSLFAPDGSPLGLSGPRSLPAGMSADGLWQAGQSCGALGTACQLQVSYRGGPAQAVPLAGGYAGGAWSEMGAHYALTDVERHLYLLDPSTNTPALIAADVSAYTWTVTGALAYASQEDGAPALWRWDGRDARRLASVDGQISHLYRTAHGSQVAFTLDAADGWRLLTLDVQTAALVDFGNLGRVPERNTTIARAPMLAVAWSQDQRTIAVSPVAQPYVLYLLDAGGSVRARHFFEEGYAGELAWSPAGGTLAVSTYSPDRSRHEVYLVDVAAGGAPRHLLDGCHIRWSPDGRFLAVKREPVHAAGVAAIQVDSGRHWPVVRTGGTAPLSWGTDNENAVRLAQQPVRSSAVLTK